MADDFGTIGRMQTGPIMRTPKTQRRYVRGGLGSKECPFCGINEKEPRKIYEETAHFYRVENIFGYDIWDGCVVSEHQLIVPKHHLLSLAEMTDEEGLDYLKLVLSAEANGYGVYTRGVDGPMKSVAHVHTHLIKLDPSRKIKLLFFIRKPHVLLFRTPR